MPTIAADLALAERLDLVLRPYATDPQLACIVLDAIIRRGWRPTLDYQPAHGTWHAMLRRGDAFQRAEGQSLAQAVVFAALGALELDTHAL